MKKAVLFFTTMTMSASLLTGCSLFKPTAESLITKCAKKMENVNAMDLDLTVGFGLNVSKDGTEVAIDFDALADVLYQKQENNDYNSYADIEMTLTMLGGISQSIEGECYIVGEGDTVTTYTKAKDAQEWSKEEEKKEEEEEDSLSKSDYTELAKQLVLAEETVTENGKECYVLEGDVENDSFFDKLDELGLGDLDEENKTIHMIMKIDKKEKLPVSITLELDDEIFKHIMEETGLASLTGVEGVSMEIEAFEIGLIFNEIDGDTKVEIPEEVLEAKEESGAEDGFNLFDVPSDENTNDDANLENDVEKDTDTEEDVEIETNSDNVSKADFEAAGFTCDEYVWQEESIVYLMITNNNSQAKEVEINANFLKDGEVVDQSYRNLYMEEDSYYIADFFSTEEFDSVEYSFKENDLEGVELAGKDIEIEYDIDEYGYITGTITNNSDKAVSFPQAHFVLMNADKEVMEFQTAYAEADVVQPSESSTFDLYITHTDYDSIQVYGVAEVEE